MSDIEGGNGLVEAMGKVVPENKGPLYAALAAAQKAFRPIVRSKTVRVQSSKGNYTFDYAPLESVIDATRDALSDNGLALFQPLGHEGGELVLTTILAHASGLSISTRMVLPQKTTGYDKDGNQFDRMKTAQEIGSAVTYMRRYMAQCILGVNAEEDDDGAQGEDMARETKPREQARTAATPPRVASPKPAQQSAPPKPAEPKAPPAERQQTFGDPPVPGPGQADPATLAKTGLPAQEPSAPEDSVGEKQPERPASTPPPADAPKPSKESMGKMRALIQELGMQKMVPEWCEKILGVSPAAITLESQIQVLIADLEQRKAATA